jgi:hypothetical protein
VIFCTVRRADGDDHIRLAPRQVEDARQGDDLDFKIRVLLADGRADLGQQEIGAAIRRTDPDLPREAARLPAQLGRGLLHRLFGADRVGHQPRARLAQRITGGGFGEKRCAKVFLEPGDAAAHRGRVDPQHTARARQAFLPRDSKEYADIVPMRHHSRPLLQNCKSIMESCLFFIEFCKARLLATSEEDPRCKS